MNISHNRYTSNSEDVPDFLGKRTTWHKELRRIYIIYTCDYPYLFRGINKAGSAAGAYFTDLVSVSKAVDSAMPPTIQAAGASTSISRTYSHEELKLTNKQEKYDLRKQEHLLYSDPT